MSYNVAIRNYRRTNSKKRSFQTVEFASQRDDIITSDIDKDIKGVTWSCVIGEVDRPRKNTQTHRGFVCYFKI